MSKSAVRMARKALGGCPKLTADVHSRSHLILGAVPSVGRSQNSPDSVPTARQAAALLPIDADLADAAYNAEHNHRRCRWELGFRDTMIPLNPRNVGRRWPKVPHRPAMRRGSMRETYHQRWDAGSGFSQHKRRLGATLTARSDAAQRRELALRALTPQPHARRSSGLGLSAEHP